ncbi:two-component regulator propeller domain-containing protein [Saccharicrinis sp. FJH62]|uniref:ligand-binding sensor domain-containing protein n=1 Tax=Saccharicrinis sp. FJH62 TaxID=3344657 RepID=UPI0035D4252D
MKNLFLFIMFYLASFSVLSQSNWKSFNTENGLDGNYARKHLVCKSGDVWLLTGHTVNIYDGNVWKNIDQITDTVTGEQVVFEDIMYMNEDPSEHVWLGTKTGLIEYDGKQWQFHREQWNKRFGWQGFTIKYYSMDAQGYIWAFLEKFELFPRDFTQKWTIGLMYRFNGTEWEIYPGMAGRTAMRTLEKNKHFKQFFTDKYKNFWVLTYNGFRIWNGENWQIYNGVKQTELDCQVTDNDGNIWLGNKYGLQSYNGSEWTTYKKKNGLAADWVYFLYVDDKNRIWAFTKSHNYNVFRGLSFYQDNKWTSYNFEKDGFVFPIYSANSPGDGNFWIGGENGVSVFDGNSWQTYTTNNGLLKGKYNWIIKDRNDHIWACSDNKYLQKLEEDTWNPVFVTESDDEAWWYNYRFKDSTGNIWLGVNNKGIYKFDGDNWSRYTKEDVLASNTIKHIFEDKQENIWVITENGVSVCFK